MIYTAVLMTHALARENRKLPFFLSRFTFDEIKKRKNTHFCFACLSHTGFTPNAEGAPTNNVYGDDGYTGMEDHDASHSQFVIGNANKYENAQTWILKELPQHAPVVVCVT